MDVVLNLILRVTFNLISKIFFFFLLSFLLRENSDATYKNVSAVFLRKSTQQVNVSSVISPCVPCTSSNRFFPKAAGVSSIALPTNSASTPTIKIGVNGTGSHTNEDSVSEGDVLGKEEEEKGGKGATGGEEDASIVQKEEVSIVVEREKIKKTKTVGFALHDELMMYDKECVRATEYIVVRSKAHKLKFSELLLRFCVIGVISIPYVLCIIIYNIACLGSIPLTVAFMIKSEICEKLFNISVTFGLLIYNYCWVSFTSEASKLILTQLTFLALPLYVALLVMIKLDTALFSSSLLALNLLTSITFGLFAVPASIVKSEQLIYDCATQVCISLNTYMVCIIFCIILSSAVTITAAQAKAKLKIATIILLFANTLGYIALAAIAECTRLIFLHLPAIEINPVVITIACSVFIVAVVARATLASVTAFLEGMRLSLKGMYSNDSSVDTSTLSPSNSLSVLEEPSSVSFATFGLPGQLNFVHFTGGASDPICLQEMP